MNWTRWLLLVASGIALAGCGEQADMVVDPVPTRAIVKVLGVHVSEDRTEIYLRNDGRLGAYEMDLYGEGRRLLTVGRNEVDEDFVAKTTFLNMRVTAVLVRSGTNEAPHHYRRTDCKVVSGDDSYCR